MWNLISSSCFDGSRNEPFDLPKLNSYIFFSLIFCGAIWMKEEKKKTELKVKKKKKITKSNDN